MGTLYAILYFLVDSNKLIGKSINIYYKNEFEIVTLMKFRNTIILIQASGLT